MKTNMKVRALTLVASMALLGGTAFAASGQTGAYLSDSVSGTMSGTLGSIHISAPTPNITFDGLLPGSPQSQTVSFTNTGNSPEDVYLTFPNLTALSALNNLGHYGKVNITSQVGAGNVTDMFYSSNLDDNSTSCGAFSNTSTQYFSGEAPGTLGMNCWPLPDQVLVASNVAAGESGSFTFTFTYAGALTDGSNAPVNTTFPWNSFPVSGQTTTISSDGSGNGLPYTIVATQVGITPGQTGYKF